MGKFASVINYVSFHEDVRKSGVIALREINLGSKWRLVINFTSWLLYL
jgi:hypothetical protein